MSLAILCVISIWHAVIAILPVNVISPFDDTAIFNSSAAAINVTSTNPNLLHQTLSGTYQPIPSPFARPTVPKNHRQRRTWKPIDTNIQGKLRIPPLPVPALQDTV